MITNDVQYRNTKTLLAQFRQAAENLEAENLADAIGTKLHQLQIDAVRSQADDLEAEIAEYEQLRSGATTSFTANSLADLSKLLIQGRIARGWSQRRLAEELGIHEQQIQRYEANGYATTSLTRLCEVAAALDLQMTETARLATPAA